jgi:hypothetical protein
VGEIQKDERWTPSELAGRMEELFSGHPTAYSPQRSALRQVTGIGEDGARGGPS